MESWTKNNRTIELDNELLDSDLPSEVFPVVGSEIYQNDTWR